MSAELLAEFGHPKCFGRKNGKQAHELDEDSLQQTKALIPGLFDASNLIVPVVEGDGRPPEDLWRKDGNGVDVLFDVSRDQCGQSEDFGDFEHGEQEKTHNPQHSEPRASSAAHSLALLDLEGGIDPSQSSKGNEPRHHEEDWSDFLTAISHQKPKQEDVSFPAGASDQGQVPAIVGNAENEDWDSFEDGEPAAGSEYTSNRSSVTSPANHQNILELTRQIRGLPSSEKATATSAVDGSRPTNVPPPVILLQVLPKLFQHIGDVTNTGQSAQLCNIIIQAHTIASRIIAGRSLRWKRDTSLSQSVKIGPAASGGKGGGMKLSAVDRKESLKEDREIADVIKAWNRHAYLFNSTIHKAGSKRPLMTLSENLRPRSAKGAEILTSPHACALCGLKRDERIPEADIDVDDSFGEFWIQHWGHCMCRDFWSTNQALLPQR